MESIGSRLLRSFSPTKDSRAIISEKEIGKKPTIINKKGLIRSTKMGLVYCETQLVAQREVKSIRKGKMTVSTMIGVTIRQSRKLSRSSRRVIIRAVPRLLRSWRGIA